jgi:hypothetical protein
MVKILVKEVRGGGNGGEPQVRWRDADEVFLEATGLLAADV